MKYLIGGKEYEKVTGRVREICEAEQALQMSLSAGVGAATAISAFVSIRRAHPEWKAFRIADLVMDAEFSDDMLIDDEVEEEETDSPPAEEPDETESGEEEDETSGLESQRTSGPLRSVAQA